MGLSNELSCEAGSFSHCPTTPTGVFSQRFEALFPGAGTLGCAVCLTPQLFLPVYLPANVESPSPKSAASLSPPAAALPSSLLGCPSPSFLPVWMSVSSLTPLLWDFHTVQFSVSSGCLLFLNLLSFFWLCEDALCVYLHLPLGSIDLNF